MFKKNVTLKYNTSKADKYIKIEKRNKLYLVNMQVIEILIQIYVDFISIL